MTPHRITLLLEKGSCIHKLRMGKKLHALQFAEVMNLLLPSSVAHVPTCTRALVGRKARGSGLSPLLKVGYQRKASNAR